MLEGDADGVGRGHVHRQEHARAQRQRQEAVRLHLEHNCDTYVFKPEERVEKVRMSTMLLCK